MCKVLSEGGPCYSHLNQKIQILREDMKFDSRQQAIARGIAPDLEALQKEQEQITQSANQIIDVHNTNIAQLHADATLISNRGKKSKEDYRPEEVDRARKLFSFRMGHPDDENLDEGFRKIAMAEALTVRIRTLDYEISTQQEAYNAKLEAENPSENTLDLYRKKIEKAQREKVICESRKNELEKSASKDFKGDKKALITSRKISQQILPSAEYLNAQEQFVTLKESLQKTQKEASAIKKARDKELKRSNAYPPVTGTEYEVFVEREYPQTVSAQSIMSQISGNQNELSQTPTFINELRARGNALGGYQTTAGRELMVEANRFAEQKIRRVAEAQGKNRADINHAVGSDPHITAEREYRATMRYTEMANARKKYERDIVEKKKNLAIAKRELEESIKNPKPPIHPGLSKVTVRGLAPKPGLRKFTLNFESVTSEQSQRIDQLKAKNDAVIARKFKAAENKVYGSTAVSLQASSRYVVRPQSKPSVQKNFSQEFAHTKPRATLVISERALTAQIVNLDKSEQKVVRRPLPPKPSKPPVVPSASIPNAQKYHRHGSTLPLPASRPIPPKPQLPPRSASSLALDALRAQKNNNARPLPPTRPAPGGSVMTQNESTMFPPRPTRRFPRPAKLKSDRSFDMSSADPEPHSAIVLPEIAYSKPPITREMPALRIKPRSHGKFDEVILARKNTPLPSRPASPPNPNQKRREQIFSRFRPSRKNAY